MRTSWCRIAAQVRCHVFMIDLMSLTHGVATGMINEERMSVYVRLGIRLLYKGLKSRDMENKRSRWSRDALVSFVRLT